MTAALDDPSQWAANGIQQAAMAVRERLRADYGGTGVDDIDLVADPSFATGTARTTLRGPGRDPILSEARQLLTDALDARDIIVVAGRHRFPAHLEWGVESACAYVADALQDDVMDALGRPWPAPTHGELAGVLQATCGESGIAHWRLKGEAICAVGHLRAFYDRLGSPWP